VPALYTDTDTDLYNTITIITSTPAPPDATIGTATLTSPAWVDSDSGSEIVLYGDIHFNQMVVDFSAIGGGNAVTANLTQSGDMQWLDAENIWERSLCDASSTDSSSSSSGSDLSTTEAALVGAAIAVGAGCIVALFVSRWRSSGKDNSANLDTKLLA
jgi:hypothetical protein